MKLTSIPKRSHYLLITKKGKNLSLINSSSYKGILILMPFGVKIFSRIDGKRTLYTIEELVKNVDGYSPMAFIELMKQLELFHLIYFGKEKPYHSIRESGEYKDGDVFKAWIALTNQCNFRCSYCFVNKTAERMSDSLIDKVVRSIVANAKKAGYKKIELILAGGEPLLEEKFILNSNDLALKEAKASGIDCSVGIVTNGYLLNDRICGILKSANIAVSISIDGLGQFQNLVRSLKNGMPTYDKVIANAARAKKFGILTAFLITVTAINQSNLFKFTKYILEYFDVPIVYSFFKDNSYAKQNMQPDSKMLLPEFKKILNLFFLHFKKKKLRISPVSCGFVNIDYVINKYPYYPILSSCGAGSSYLTYTHKGEIKFCLQQETVSNNLSVQTGRDDFKMIEMKAKRYFEKTNIEQNDECNRCFWKHICAGGCKMDRLKNIAANIYNSAYCELYKKLIAYHLDLESDRIIGLK